MVGGSRFFVRLDKNRDSLRTTGLVINPKSEYLNTKRIQNPNLWNDRGNGCFCP